MKDETAARSFATHNLTLSLIISVVWASVLFIFASFIISFYELKEHIANDAVNYLRVVSTAFPFVFMSAAFTGMFNAGAAASVVIKASAGASEFLPTVVSEDLGKTVISAREKGLKVYCAERRDAVSLYEKDLTEPVILAIGGEMRGLSRAVLDNADGNVFIPYGSGFRCALSASAASAVIGFEVMRQRMK